MTVLHAKFYVILQIYLIIRKSGAPQKYLKNQTYTEMLLISITYTFEKYLLHDQLKDSLECLEIWEQEKKF